MIDSKTVDLIIRAQLEGKADLASVTKGIRELEKALEAQTQAAKKGESSIDELKATLLSLEQVQRNLKTNASLVREFDALPTKIDRATRSVEKSKTAYEALAEEQKKSAQVTEAQAQRLFDLSARYENAQKRLDGLTARQGVLREELVKLGADTNDLAGFQNQLNTALGDAAVVYGKTQRAISGYGETVRAARDAQRELAQQQAQAAREAAQFEAAEKRAAAASEARAAAARAVAEAQANRRAESTAAGNQFADDAAAAARARELAQLREDITRRSEEQLTVERQLAKNNSLAKSADEAQKAARQYETLANASSDLAPKLISVRSAVDDILNPSKAVVSTLAGVEGKINDLSATIGKINGPVKDYRETLASLNETQRALAAQAGLIDAYRRQEAVVRAAREEYVKAREKVDEYAAAVRKGGSDVDQMLSSLSRAKGAAESSGAAYQKQVAALNETKEALRTAGVNTNDLANAQTRLLNSSRQAQAAASNLGDAVKKYGEEAQEAGRKSGKGIFGDEGRTTLSLAQRIRGEILALTASYVGLQGAISTATGALESFNNRASTRTVIGVGLQTTDKAQIDAEYNYIKQQADRIGLVFADTAKQYGKFAASAAFAGRDRNEIRYIFESFSEAGRVLGLTQDNLNGVFVALEQIFSKGKIGAEELKQQLGERLPAVFEVAQKALQDQYPDLAKAMEKGQVGAENLVLIAQKYREMIAGQLPEATKSLAAQQARLTNAVEDFKLAIADAGFVDAYAATIEEISKFLKSEDGKQFAEGMAGAFSSVLEIIKLLLKNFDELSAIVSAGVWLFSANLFLKIAENLWTVSKAATAASVAMSGFQKAFLILGAAIVGWEIGKYLNDKFKEVRAFGVALVTGMDIAWTKIKYGAQIAFEAIPTYVENLVIKVDNLMLRMTRGIARTFADLAKAAGLNSVAETYTKFADGLIEKTYKKETDKAAALRKQMEADLATIKQIQSDMYDEILASDKKIAAKASPTATAFPGKGGNTRNTGPTEAEIAKAARELESLEDRVLSLEGRIERASSQTLAVQLQGVDKSTKDLKDDITSKVKDAEKRQALLARVDAATAQLRLQTTDKFNKETLTAEESLQRQLEEAQAAAGKRQKESLEARLNAIKLRYEKFFREADELIKRQKDNGLDTSKTEGVKANMTANVAELQQLEAKKFYEEEINRVIKERQQLVEAVRAEQQAGAITQDQAAQRINELNAQSVPIITSIKNQAIQWAQANDQIFNNPEAQEAFIERMRAISTEATNVKTEFGVVETTAIGALKNGIGPALDTTADAFAKMLDGQMSLSEGFRSLGRSAGMFFVQLLKDIAKAVLQAIILRAVMSAFGVPAAGAGAASAGTASIPSNVAHTGGRVGSLQRSRLADPSWFANAPRYHSGGISGLAPDEYPAILQKNEEVLSASDPRNIMNGGAGVNGTSQQAPTQPMRFVLVDDRTKVAEAMNSADGEKVVMQIITRNSPSLRQMFKG